MKSMENIDCRGCDWLSFVRTSKNHNNSGRDVDIYYCLEPERLENIGYDYLDGNYLYRCSRYKNLKETRKEKLDRINEH